MFVQIAKALIINMKEVLNIEKRDYEDDALCFSIQFVGATYDYTCDFITESERDAAFVRLAQCIDCIKWKDD